MWHISGTYRTVLDPSLASKSTVNLRVVVRPGTTQPGLPSLEVLIPPPTAGDRTDAELRAAVLSNTGAVYVAGAGARSKRRNPRSPIRARGGTGSSRRRHDAFWCARDLHCAGRHRCAGGIAKLQLVPAPSGGSNLTYRVSIVSPSRLPYASVSRDMQVGPTDGLLSALTLPTRSRLIGRLLSARAASRCRAAGRGAADCKAGGSPQSAGCCAGSDAAADDHGQRRTVCATARSGDYDLDMIPVLGTGPRTSLDNQRIRDVDVDLGEVRLPRLALAKVLVVGPSLAPAPQVKVRVLELPDTSPPRYGLACTLDLPCSEGGESSRRSVYR